MQPLEVSIRSRRDLRGIEPGLRDRHSINRSLIPGKGQRFFSPPNVLIGSGFQSATYSVGKWKGVTRVIVAGA